MVGYIVECDKQQQTDCHSHHNRNFAYPFFSEGIQQECRTEKMQNTTDNHFFGNKNICTYGDKKCCHKSFYSPFKIVSAERTYYSTDTDEKYRNNRFIRKYFHHQRIKVFHMEEKRKKKQRVIQYHQDNCCSPYFVQNADTL